MYKYHAFSKNSELYVCLVPVCTITKTKRYKKNYFNIHFLLYLLLSNCSLRFFYNDHDYEKILRGINDKARKLDLKPLIYENIFQPHELSYDSRVYFYLQKNKSHEFEISPVSGTMDLRTKHLPSSSSFNTVLDYIATTLVKHTQVLGFQILKTLTNIRKKR